MQACGWLGYRCFTLHHKCFEPVLDEVFVCDETLKKELISASIKLHKHLNCYDFSRSDFKIDKNGVPYFREINPRPVLRKTGHMKHVQSISVKPMLKNR
jgi:D-alanine-D-alanine ligase